MSASRKRKKSTRHQAVTGWEATTASDAGGDAPHRNGHAPSRVDQPEPAAGTRATQPGHGVQPRTFGSAATISDAIDTMVQALDVELDATPARGGVAELGAEPPRDALEDQFYWEDHEQDFRDADDQAEGDGADVRDAPTRPTGRRRVVAVAVAAPLIFAGAFLAGGWIIDQVQDQPGAGLAAIPPVATPAPSGAVAAPRSVADRYVPGATAGPGLTAPGVLVRATPTADGSLEVVERIRFDQPVSEVSLGPPLTKGVAIGSRPTHIEIADLQIQADDDIVDVGQGRVTKARTIELPGGASAVVMRYRLTGATVRSVPSTPGRALTVLPPITSPATLGSLPFVVELSGASVTNVLCPGLRTADQLCGRTWPLGWFAPPQQPGRTAVLAQLNLPDPVSR